MRLRQASYFSLSKLIRKDGDYNLIRNPTNIYPYNNPIDVTVNNTFRFNFSGDKLGMYRVKIRDLDTDDIVYTSQDYHLHPGYKYNNDLIEITIPMTTVSTPNYMNGKNYIWCVEMSENNSTLNSTTEFKSLDYYFKSLRTPEIDIYINGISAGPENIVDSRKVLLTTEYFQEQNVSVKYFSVTLKDVNGGVVDRTEKIFSSNITYEFDGLFTDSNYTIELVVETQENQVVGATSEFYVNYDNSINFIYPPVIAPVENKAATKVSWIKNKISNGDSDGEYSFENDTYVNITGGTIKWDKISTYPILVDSDNFGFAIKTKVNSDTKKILDFIYNNVVLSVFIENGEIFFKNGSEQKQKIIDILENKAFLLQNASSVPVPNTEYIWYSDNTHIWNASNSIYWMLTPYYEHEFIIIINKVDGVIQVEVKKVVS